MIISYFPRSYIPGQLDATMKILINIWITFFLLTGLSRKRMVMAQKSSRYDPDKHHRRSIRYKGCDYCTPGVYFITMRTHAFQCLFGQIRNGVMYLNAFGKIVEEEWLMAPFIRPYIALDAFVVMPDHFHGIIIIKPQPVGATCQVAPTDQVAPTGQVALTGQPNGPKSGSIGAILGQFKMQVTKRINALRLDNQEPGTSGSSPLRVWQRNYYDRILRDRVALQRVRTYIINNPRNVKRKPS
jgi:REP element-mobilizing transposase RayT